MPSPLRILDVNANRAREALRVMEDAARFLLNDAPLSGDLKQLRHDLAHALAGIPELAAHRDTPGDVGTAISTPAEATRADAPAVVTAAGKRLAEALRSIEEYAKLLPPEDCAPSASAGPASAEPERPVSATLEQIRYRAYDLEARLNRAMQPSRARQWRLCLLLTQSLCAHHPWQDVLRLSLDAGLDCVQVREKRMDAGPLLGHVAQVMQIVAGRATVIVNDRPDVAAAAGAHGVHVGQTDLPPAAVRRHFGRQLILGVSTTNLDQARAALGAGADYVGLGPMFPTTTVDNKPGVAGPEYVRDFIAEFPAAPHLAVGGITPANAAPVLAAGARGLAVSSAICAAADPREATHLLLTPSQSPTTGRP